MIWKIWQWIKSQFEIHQFRITKCGQKWSLFVHVGDIHEVLGIYNSEADAQAALGYFKQFPEYTRCYYHRSNRIR